MPDLCTDNLKHAFITYKNKEDALNAIDNMHLNEIKGYLIKCNISRRKT